MRGVDHRRRSRRKHARHQRSTSPNTKSIEPMIATVSASMCPLLMTSSACRCENPVGRILQRYGRLVPSDTKIHAELALWAFDRGVGRARRHVKAFGIQLEMMDQRLHRALHLLARRRRELAVLDLHRPRLHLLDALPMIFDALAHLDHPHQIAVVAVAIARDWNLEFHLVVHRVGLGLRRSQGTPLARKFGPVKPQANACSAVITPISTVRCFQIRFSVSRFHRSSMKFGKVSLHSQIRSVSPPANPCHPARPDSSLHAAARRTPPRRTPSASRAPRSPTGGRERTDVEREGCQVQQMVQDPRDLVEHRADPLRPLRRRRSPAASRSPARTHAPCTSATRNRADRNTAPSADRSALDELLRAAMQQPDMRIGPLDDLAVHLQNQAQHAVRRRMLRPEVDRVAVDLHRRPCCRGRPARARRHGSMHSWPRRCHGNLRSCAFSSPGSVVMPSHGDRKSKFRKSCVSFTGS